MRGQQVRNAENMKPNIPETWRVITGHLVEAETAQLVLADTNSPRPMRDQASKTYVRAADSLVEELVILRMDGTLAAIADFLKAREDG